METLKINNPENVTEKSLSEGIKPQPVEKQEKDRDKKPAGFSLSRLVPALALVAAGLLSMSGEAQAVSATASASINFLAPITVTKTTDLNFGTVITTGTAGSLTLSAAGVRSITGGTLGSAVGVSAASFAVTGAGAYSISMPTPVPLSLSDGATHTAILRSYLLSKTSGTANPNDTFSVGATIDVPSANVPGTYTGSFSVSVDYQ